MSMSPRIRPRIFPRTIIKTSVLALGLILWLLYFYSSNYAYDRRPDGDGGAKRSDRNILRRPTVPSFEGIEAGQNASDEARPEPDVPVATRRGNYKVIPYLLDGRRGFRYNQSITITTHATYELLDNLIYLSRRWGGPISVAVYAPHDDFRTTLTYALWLRKCHPTVGDLVTFHFVYPADSNDTQQPQFEYERLAQEALNASEPLPGCGATSFALPHSYRHRHKLPYPINVCRNVARLNARTHYVLASDIELYPSTDVVGMFLNFSRGAGLVQRPGWEATEKSQTSSLTSFFLGGQAATHSVRRVYVLPIFEVDKSVRDVPGNKRALVELYRRKKAVYFHKHVCSFCNIIPRLNRWLVAPVPKGRLGVFMTIKRHKPFNRWEPIYIGTNNEPLYDERLSWEGQQDKMTQMYELCLMNYDLAILDNAFLVHRPGIKTKNVTEYKLKSSFIAQNNRVYKNIITDLEKKHGTNSWCK